MKYGVLQPQQLRFEINTPPVEVNDSPDGIESHVIDALREGTVYPKMLLINLAETVRQMHSDGRLHERKRRVYSRLGEKIIEFADKNDFYGSAECELLLGAIQGPHGDVATAKKVLEAVHDDAEAPEFVARAAMRFVAGVRHFDLVANFVHMYRSRLSEQCEPGESAIALLREFVELECIYDKLFLQKVLAEYVTAERIDGDGLPDILTTSPEDVIAAVIAPRPSSEGMRLDVQTDEIVRISTLIHRLTQRREATSPRLALVS